jgi:predicted RNase H-like HicB family nuclease
MKVQVIIERGADGAFDANMEFINSIPFGLLGQGKTVSEAIDDFYNSYGEIKAMYRAEGSECPTLEFEFKYDMPSFLQYYAYAFTLSGLERITGVNQRQLSHYINGVKRPGEKTVRKIENRIHLFANEISSISFV